MITKKMFGVSLCMLVSFMLFSCSNQRDYSDIENLLNRWANSVRYLNYAEYIKLEAYPKDSNTFKTMYQNYYITNLQIVEVDDKLHNGTDSDGKPYEFKNVKFIATIINRQSGKGEQVVNGDIKLIRYATGTKKEKGWLLSNRTLIHQ